MSWYDPSKPVISPEKQIESKYPGMKVPVLPARAVVFCLGKGMPVLKEHYPCRQLMEKLPGFITHSEVLGIDGIPGVCFLHGGYAAPQIACAVETLHVLGVKEVSLVGLCGGFAAHLSVGDIILPDKVWSEEGTSRHYLEDPGFAQVTPSFPFETLASFFQEKGFRVFRESTVTTDAVYRQTYGKEQFWRDKGCVAVDMEASTLVNLCNLYEIRNSVSLMVSDRHPLSENDPSWQWGNADYGELLNRFILDNIAFNTSDQRCLT